MNQKITKIYLDFFNEFGIDHASGVLQEKKSIKFMTMPFIGSKYKEAKTKILFIGMDIGKDESAGRGFHSLQDRKQSIENDNNFNPHIAGTYCSALFLLKDDYDWHTEWEEINKYRTYSQATKKSYTST